jgi:hypothetical protein
MDKKTYNIVELSGNVKAVSAKSKAVEAAMDDDDEPPKSKKGGKVKASVQAAMEDDEG